MKFYFLTLLCLLQLSSFPQSIFTGNKEELDQETQLPNNKQWYNKLWEKVNESDTGAVYYMQYITTGNNIQVKGGTKTNVYNNVNYVRIDEKYLLNGIVDTRSENGKALALGRFRNGIPVIVFNTWYESGKKRSTYPVNGIYKAYSEDEKLMISGKIVNGLGDGTFIYFNKDGSKSAVYNYKKGVLLGLQTEYTSGKTKEWVVSTAFETVGEIKEGLQRIKKGSLYGFSDKTGKIIIPIKYTKATDFENGKSDVQESNYYSINKKGEKIEGSFKVNWDQYDDTAEVYDGIRRVKLNNKYGYVTEAGKQITEIIYGMSDISFDEGMARVMINEKWGYINKEGKVIIPLQYWSALPFFKGIAKVSQLSNNEINYGFVDKKGKIIIPITYKSAYPQKEEDIIIAEKRDGKYGLLNYQGVTVAPFIYSEIGFFDRGKASAKLDGEKFYINRNGERINNVQSQKNGNTKKAVLEFVKLDALNGIAHFTDKASKEKYEYNIFYMQKEQYAEYAKVSKAIKQAYDYCKGADMRCDFYGQVYNAELIYDMVDNTATTKSGIPKKQGWTISSLTRDITASPATIAYVPDDINDKIYNQFYLIIGANEYELEYLSEDYILTRYGSTSLIDMRAENPDVYHKYSFRLTKESEDFTPYYKLEIGEYRYNELVALEITTYDEKGEQILDNFNASYSKKETIRYLNKKLSTVNRLKVGTNKNVYSEKNAVSVMTDNRILYVRQWGVDPGFKKCPDSKYETVFHENYKFNPGEIDKIIDGGKEEKKATGYFRILFKEETIEKREWDYSCEQEGSKYNWMESDTEKSSIKSMVVYFLQSQPGEFEQIKNALLHLRNLYKAGK